ncbi:choice-of-anchor L domain-containing protein [Phaeovulum sp.]|uniref:choice-of-anchor L domain-containing protein n=1 Tax=Phaeovulum sp. TaxID=2934796 RepID=UPI002731A7A6|nr:choice-of-anchor L domain-containing protein [Phaeovulum sp.]MDP1669352.1 choice-of-anchor L domain-containing protein [Phaeovulum sp.]MDZ4119628.1 choice-of-anchor L domain-containing protein [Phaeovulum sp.]
MATGAELSYKTNASALQMANEIFGDGVTVVSASYTGAANSSAIYGRGDALSPDATPSDTGVILSTGNAASFTQSSGDPNRATNTSTDTTGPNNDAMFNALAGTNTYDASILTVDFIPTGDTMTMQFVFASEEYPEYINSIFNDLVGVWVNGVAVEMTIGNGDASVTGINGANNQNLYIDNTTDAYNTEMDGFTVTMTLKMTVIPGQVNTLRIGIADVGDAQYDSNVLIAGNSVQTALIAHDDTLTLAPGQSKTLDVLANDTGPGGSTLTITHINGQAVSVGSTITLATGQQITLNADGTLTVLGDADTEAVNFTYTVGSSSGPSDVAYVTVNQVPCFVAGTRIATPGGLVPVEALQPGDLVLTQDAGAQPLRWAGRRLVAAAGSFAPIRIAAGSFGAHGELWLSPQHRVLVRDPLAELLFGDAEVLVAAKDLVNGTTVIRVEGGMVEYVHLLFDRHQVIWSEGLATESFLPGPQVMGAFDAPMAAEILALFPELDPETGAGYSPAARRSLRSFEAQVLLSRAEAA